MSITKYTRWKKTILMAAALAAYTFLPGTMPQAAAAPAGITGSVHGHVQNAAGVGVAGDVKLTTDSSPTETTRYKYDFPVDQNGDYKSDGVESGTYTVVFFQGDKLVDLLQGVRVNANQDNAIDVDMTRQAFIDKLTPQEKRDLAAYKAKIASTSAQVANINTNLKQARDAMASSHAKCTAPKSDADVCPPAASDYANAETLMEQAIASRPDAGLLYFTLGDAQAGQKKYDDAAVSYNKAISLNDTSKKPNPELDGAAYNNLGQTLAKAGKIPDAVTAFDAAAKAQPSQAGTYYFNEAAVFFNKGQNGDAAAFAAALTASDKAIAADPTLPVPYYIRATALIQNATVDKAGKIIAPPGCAEAYQKYLDLAPNGEYAADATAILGSLGETIHSSYKAGKKN